MYHKMTKSLVFAMLTLISQTGVQAAALPFSITGSGTADFVPLIDGTFSPHNATGVGDFLGAYTGAGEVRMVNSATGVFDSNIPFVFTGVNGELAFNYLGTVAVSPAGGTSISTEWVAEFTPVIGSGTGDLADVVGGSFIMTANTEAFEPVPGPAPGNQDVAYTWSGEGTLVFVPEPSTILLASMAGLGVLCLVGRRV